MPDEPYDVGALADLERDVTRQPILGDEQRDFLRAVNARLARGPSLSDLDFILVRWAARTLCLPPLVEQADDG